jgi:hypothetical protein
VGGAVGCGGVGGAVYVNFGLLLLVGLLLPPVLAVCRSTALC